MTKKLPTLIGIVGNDLDTNQKVANIIQFFTRTIKGNHFDTSEWDNEKPKIINMMPNKDWEHVFNWKTYAFGDFTNNLIHQILGIPAYKNLSEESLDGWSKWTVELWKYSPTDWEGHEVHFSTQQEALDYINGDERHELRKTDISIENLKHVIENSFLKREIHPDALIKILFKNYNPRPKGRAHDLKNSSELYHHKACENCKREYFGWKRQYLCPDCIADDTVQEYPQWIITDVTHQNEANAILDRNGILINVINLNENNNPLNNKEKSLKDIKNTHYSITDKNSTEILISSVEKILKKEGFIK